MKSKNKKIYLIYLISKIYTKNLEKAYFEAYDKYTNQNLDNIDLS